MAKGQVSLEFLLVLLGFIGIFLAFLPFYSNAYEASLFALDAAKAKNFSMTVQDSVQQLQFLGNGSSKIIPAEPSLKWKIYSDGNYLVLLVQARKLEKEKIFKISFPNALSFSEFELDSKKSFILKKANGKISFENLD